MLHKEMWVEIDEWLADEAEPSPMLVAKEAKDSWQNVAGDDKNHVINTVMEKYSAYRVSMTVRTLYIPLTTCI